jgi:hypothetical protein
MVALHDGMALHRAAAMAMARALALIRARSERVATIGATPEI